MADELVNDPSTQVNDLLAGANVIQRRWVIARLMAKSDAEAARKVKVDKATVCRWANKAQLDAAVAAMLQDPMEEARAIMAEAIPKAARVKVAGLDSRNELVRQGAASDVLDRGLGKATQRQEFGAVGGGALSMLVQIVRDDGHDAEQE